MHRIFPPRFLVCSIFLHAQVGINTDGSSPHPSAGLDVKFTNSYCQINTPDKAYGFSVRCICTIVILSLPFVTTTSLSGISTTTATSGRNVTTDNGSPVAARGVCWSTSQNPTLADDFLTNGTGTGAFTSSLSGLSPSTLYYVSAYATNSGTV